jgi:hypothetical protein
MDAVMGVEAGDAAAAAAEGEPAVLIMEGT